MLHCARLSRFLGFHVDMNQSTSIQHAHVLRICDNEFPARAMPATLASSYLRERGGLPPDQLVEVRFEELDSDPLAVLRRVYGAFGWVPYAGGRGFACAPRSGAHNVCCCPYASCA